MTLAPSVQPGSSRKRVWPWILAISYGALLWFHWRSGFDLGSFFQSGVRIATPLILAALGELIVEKAGLINIGIEGIVLAGAFGGFAMAIQTGSVWVGAAGLQKRKAPITPAPAIGRCPAAERRQRPRGCCASPA